MDKYLFRTNFRIRTTNGPQLLHRGEASRLSSAQAIALLDRGLAVNAHVGLDLLSTFETRRTTLIEQLGYSPEKATSEALNLVTSCLKRHESLKSLTPPSAEFIAEVEEFNRMATGKNPIAKEQATTGVGEWAGYKCNIASGCSHGCLYCYAKSIATRFKRVANSAEWQEERLKEFSTLKCKIYDSPIMFPSSHDITPDFLPAYRCHLYNILNAGNAVIIVSKPHLTCIEAICSEFSSFRDSMLFRFTIGGLDEAVMAHWEPGAPQPGERLACLRIAFEAGYKTSVSAEPMLGGREDAKQLYYLLEPYVAEDIWFGKMNRIGELRGNPNDDVSEHAEVILEQQTDSEIMALVSMLNGLPKVEWKDSIKKIIARHGGTISQQD